MPVARKTTHQVGEWQWNADKLLSRVQDQAGTSCKKWTGNSNAQVNLFGGYKSTTSRMNNANRFLWMTAYGEDISEYSVKMSCANRHCCAIDHMYLDVNLQRVGKKKR